MDGKTIVNEQEIMTAIQTFYENLYSSDIDHSSKGFMTLAATFNSLNYQTRRC